VVFNCKEGIYYGCVEVGQIALEMMEELAVYT
jgi:hypothetical protein